jgi:hypothetical protein
VPLIRLARDKRGLDTLYLLHQRSDGRGGARLRVLYFCAAPQGLVFGRPWLDAATQRALERQFPDVDFDWPALLREVEQRRLPPPIEPQARRLRPSAKTDRRPPSSEVPADKPVSAKRKRRRPSSSDTIAPTPAGSGAVPTPGDSASDPVAAPIIES